MRTGNHTTIGARFPGRPTVALAVAASMLLAAGCRKDMYDQPKYEYYDPSTIFVDGASSRPQIVGTVARGQLQADPHYYKGKGPDGKDAATFPFAVDRETLELGRERYQIYCTPCHGRLGDGRGMVVRRGFSPPPTFHAEYLRKKEVGHFFEVITNGYGAMYSYAARIPVSERWAIVAYIRTLQFSRDANPDDLDPADREALTRAASAPAITPNKMPEAPTKDHGASPREAQK